MAARIYVIPVSSPSRAGAAMVRHKRIPHRVVTLMPGLHPVLVRLAGFERHTVPALEVDGVQVQGSCRIARFLDELAPDPPLYPGDPAARPRRGGRALGRACAPAGAAPPDPVPHAHAALRAALDGE
jgi:glutathione S-transferase